MNALVASLENTSTAAVAFTANGARTLPSSGAKCVDLFATLGSIQNEAQAVSLFSQAYAEDKRIATAVALWGRDVRGGAGRRAAFRAILKHLEKIDFEVFARVLARVPELGRWDDVLVAETPDGQALAYGMVARALMAQDRLCAKWMPRKASQTDATAARLREFLGLTPKQYRKLLVKLTDVVETKMCARHWTEISYDKLPSVAAARYARAFKKRDQARYEEYLQSLVKDPSKKINVGALYPYDLVRTARYGGQDQYATAAWKQLPNFIAEGVSILPLVDTSGSMSSPAAGQVTCMDAAISLGMYISERNTGPFKNRMINFNSVSEWIVDDETKSLANRYNHIQRANWGGSTNLQSAFELILKAAVKGRVPEADMPEFLLILSDMEFNIATGTRSYYNRDTPTSENFAAIEAKYAQAGYKRPKILFWNLNARAGNSPVGMLEDGTALISGFSPSVMKTVLSQKMVTPLDAMLDVVLVDRYDVFGEQ